MLTVLSCTVYTGGNARFWEVMRNSETGEMTVDSRVATQEDAGRRTMKVLSAVVSAERCHVGGSRIRRVSLSLAG